MVKESKSFEKWQVSPVVEPDNIPTRALGETDGQSPPTSPNLQPEVPPEDIEPGHTGGYTLTCLDPCLITTTHELAL